MGGERRQGDRAPRAGVPGRTDRPDDRFFEGYLLASFTGGVVTTFVSPDAVKMWADFKSIWEHVNPNSTNY